jgi:hypothetical protein
MTIMRRRRPAAGLVFVSVLLISGCSAATAPQSAATPDSPSANSAPAGGEPDAAFECNGRFVDPKTFQSGIRADELPEEDAAGIDAGVDDAGQRGLIGELSAWVVAARSEESVTLLRPQEIEGDYEVVMFDRMDEAPATGKPGWMLTSSASCTLALDPAPLAPADVSLDPGAAPDAGSTQLALLVTERDCNSGEDAEGRVELLSLEETDTAVIVRVAVRPHAEGAFTCQSNPPTPFTLDLSEPLGERALLDGTFVTPRPIPVQTPPPP